MGGANVQIGALEELLLVLRPEDVAATAADLSGDIDSHPANRTAPTGLPFPLPSSSALALGCVRVRELEVRNHLLEVP
jgi:hypothetical protein